MRAAFRAVSLSLLTMGAVAVATAASAVKIDFDAPANGTVINNFYFNPTATSVSFSNPVGGASVYARSSSFNASPGNVVSVFQTGFPPFHALYGAVDGALNVVAPDQILTVSVMAAAVASLEPLGTPQNRPFLQAFDRNNQLLGTVYFQGALPTNPLQVTAFEKLTFSLPPCSGTPTQCSTYGIYKVRFSAQQTQPGPPIWALFDDFEWTSSTCVDAPVIPDGSGAACAGTGNGGSCSSWTCNPGFVRQGSDPVCSNGGWTGTYSCVAAPVSMSPYYNTDGDASQMFIVSPEAVASTVSTFSLAYPLAVRDSVMLGHLYGSETREFTLSGLPIGSPSPDSGPFGQLLDGTTDGAQANYAVECCGVPNSVVRADRRWKNPVALFDIPGEGRGIAYDTRQNHLFVSFLNGPLVREYDLAGNLLNTFSVSGIPFEIVGLAYEQSTDTLWGKNRAGGTLYQFDKTGGLLRSVPVAGLTPSNDFGGEMRMRPMVDFQSLAHADAQASFHGSIVGEDGFEVAAGWLGTFGTLEPRYTGSTALFDNTIDGEVTFRSSNGARFDMVSIDLAELNGSLPATVSFTGDRPDGGTVTQAFTLDGTAFGSEIFHFGPEFRDLVAVRWRQVAPYHQFDNIVAEERTAPILDFQSLAHADAFSSFHGAGLGEDGFSIAGTNLMTFGTLEPRYSGSTALFENAIDGQIVLTRVGGGAFDLYSIDLAELNGPAATTITFTGDTLGGGVVSQSFTLDGDAFGAETFEFSDDFRGVTAVRWSQVAPFHQFDNVVVPEPSTGALLIAGSLGVLAAHGRRRDGRRSSSV